MRIDLLDYVLPDDLIARRPLAERDASRLLVVDPDGLRHDLVRRWPELVPDGALVVLNDTRVERRRILGRRAQTGGRVELLLTRRIGSGPDEGEERWECLGRSSKPLRPGSVIDCEPLRFEVLERRDDGTLECRVQTSGGSVDVALEAVGRLPIPPYLGRDDDEDDVVRYQTVFARRPGSSAAPTAGLHLTEAMLDRLRARGVELGQVTLHVGLGTFKPVTVPDLDQHPMHAEVLQVDERLCEQVDQARQRSAPVLAVGTTVVRALESAYDPARPGRLRPLQGETRLLIQPGYAFRVVDGLLTNFHAPQSTLLALVAAFTGLARMQAAYAEAIRERYRFLSYGDAMWIPRRLS